MSTFGSGRKPARKRRTGARKRIRTPGIEHHDGGLELERGQRPRVIGNPQRLGGNVGVARDLGVDGDEVVLAFELQPVAADVNERDGIRPGARGLLQKIAEGAAQRVLIEIARAGDVETCRLERLRDQAGVVGRRIQCCCLIPGIADDERDALFRARGARRKDERERDQCQQHRDHSADSWHGIPSMAEARARSRAHWTAAALNGV
jgi:hypothetical protein